MLIYSSGATDYFLGRYFITLSRSYNCTDFHKLRTGRKTNPPALGNKGKPLSCWRTEILVIFGVMECREWLDYLAWVRRFLT